MAKPLKLFVSDDNINYLENIKGDQSVTQALNDIIQQHKKDNPNLCTITQ